MSLGTQVALTPEGPAQKLLSSAAIFPGPKGGPFHHGSLFVYGTDPMAFCVNKRKP